MFEDEAFGGGGDQSSMFPFLSVLFCTIGALMIIMFFGTMSATLSDSSVFAEQKAQEEREASLNEMFDDIDETAEAAVSLGTMSKQVKQQTARVAITRNKAKQKDASLSGIRQKSARVIEQSKKAAVFQETQVASVRRMTFRKKHTESRAEVERREAELEELEAKARALRKSVTELQGASKTPTARLIYNSQGTARGLPFFIELTPEGIIVHSDGVELKTKELISLRASLGRKGALLKAVRYVARPGSKEYLALLLRPNTYKLYKTAMSYCKKLRASYTIEPIQNDWILNFANNSIEAAPATVDEKTPVTE